MIGDGAVGRGGTFEQPARIKEAPINDKVAVENRNIGFID